MGFVRWIYWHSRRYQPKNPYRTYRTIIINPSHAVNLRGKHTHFFLLISAIGTSSWNSLSKRRRQPVVVDLTLWELLRHLRTYVIQVSDVHIAEDFHTTPGRELQKMDIGTLGLPLGCSGCGRLGGNHSGHLVKTCFNQLETNGFDISGTGYCHNNSICGNHWYNKESESRHPRIEKKRPVETN